MSRNSLTLARRGAPTVVGSRPHSLLLTVTAALAAAACSGSNASDQLTQPVDLGMTSKMVPYYQDENLTLYEAQTPVPLPVRKPTADDYKGLGAAPKGTPYPHAPYLTASDESVLVHYTISNIDSQDHAVWLLIDPWNEFVRWAPGVTIVDDETTTPNWGYDEAFLVPAMSRITGTLTSDDLQEIAIKLASAENVLNSAQAKAAEAADAGTAAQSFDPTSIANNIFNPQNRSNGFDPLYTPWIPPVIAGVTGFDLGLRTMEAANVAVEITMEVQDVNGNRFVTSGSTEAQIGLPPMTLSPPGAKM
jgi:ABC-type glycerol-3-phosphate transport system substrate-binding protein